MKIAGIVLAGGRSRRMGVAKATLPFGPESLLERIVRIVGEVASPVVVVAAQEQILPTLPKSVVVSRDRHPDRGPLEAMAVGLIQASDAEAVFITACDTPLVTAKFIHRVISLLELGRSAAVPLVDELPQPLSSAYRPSVATAVEQMLAEGQFKLQNLLARIPTRWIRPDELHDIDPRLQSLWNLNTPADYAAALAAAGLPDHNLP